MTVPPNERQGIQAAILLCEILRESQGSTLDLALTADSGTGSASIFVVSDPDLANSIRELISITQPTKTEGGSYRLEPDE